MNYLESRNLTLATSRKPNVMTEGTEDGNREAPLHDTNKLWQNHGAVTSRDADNWRNRRMTGCIESI